MRGVAAVAAGAYALSYAMAVLGGLFDAGPAVVAASLLLALYLIVEAPRVPRPQLVLSGALMLVGAALGWWSGAPVRVVLLGLERTLPLMVLFAAVAFLNRPALSSPAFREVGRTVVSQPPGRRFLVLSTAGSALGAVLNLAGLHLMLSLLGRQSDPRLERRLTLAAMRGFSAAAAWSPFFVAMAVVLTVLPGLSWLQVAPGGLAVAVVLLSVAYGLDRVTRGPRPLKRRPAPPFAPWAVGSALLVFVMLAVPVIGLSEAVGISVPLAIGVVAPAVALVWQARLAGPPRALEENAALLREHFAKLPVLRGEGFVFTGANVLGAGIAASLDPAAVSRVVEAAGVGPEASLLMLLAALTLLGALGLHPVILVVVVGQVLPPQAVGVPPWAMGIALLAGWSLGTAMSPFSGTVMQVARFVRRPAWEVAWRWNAPYCLAAMVPVGGLLVLLPAMFG